jgi:hypothetical protein
MNESRPLIDYSNPRARQHPGGRPTNVGMGVTAVHFTGRLFGDLCSVHYDGH